MSETYTKLNKTKLGKNYVRRMFTRLTSHAEAVVVRDVGGQVAIALSC
jgi:hypothetical protein